MYLLGFLFMLRFTTQTYNKRSFLFKDNQPGKMELVNGLIRSICLFDIAIPYKLDGKRNVRELVRFINNYIAIDKETLTCLVEDIVNGTKIDLIDHKEILVSRKTRTDIHRNCFFIITKNDYLTFKGVELETFFQVLSNNYPDDNTKLDFLNFFARYGNQDGFLNMGQTQVLFAALRQEIHIQVSDKKFIIFLNKNNKFTGSVKVLECFTVNEIMQNNNIQPISAIIGLWSIIDITKKQKIVNKELFVYAEDKIAVKLSRIIEGTGWVNNHENTCLSKNNNHTPRCIWKELLLTNYNAVTNPPTSKTMNYSYQGRIGYYCFPRFF